MSTSERTKDHAVIQEWAEERGGHPAAVRTGERGGVLRIDFGEPEPNLEPISWNEFFRIFDDRHLAFLYQDLTADGKPSRFFKLISERTG